ncbi:exonuclease domain-containing protein [Bacillus benzoevorans]|uniref:DNA polymerase-3 subunit epsilon n=1 Tax=Bacillus benzoevorans TaxID=1456 RepID=A0A7X0HRY5_9BACI|nr:exonuclease domain-containing protein [Bacillus benzoevorans]MBB6444575.1 DNA polymerase-3 subunit epsilon [Bacillus benzoevorans]
MAFEPFFHFVKGLQSRLNNSGSSGTYYGQSQQQMAYLRSLEKDKKQREALYVPLNQLEAVVFDIETSGFFPEKGDEMLSLGAVKVCGGVIQKEQLFYSLVHYEKPLSPEIASLTNLSGSQLKDAPPLGEVLSKFLNFVQGSTLVAHHANHEKSFLQSASRRIFRAPFKHRIVDTSFLYRIAEPKLNMVRLDEFCEHHDIPIINRHHALGDAILTAKLWTIYIEMVQRLGCKTLHDVYERVARL